MRKFLFSIAALFVLLLGAGLIVAQFPNYFLPDLSGKPKDIPVQLSSVAFLNHCMNIDSHTLGLRLNKAVIINMRDPQWLYQIKLPEDNVTQFERELSSCYEKELTIQRGDVVREIIPSSRPSWWEPEKIIDPEVLSFYLKPHLNFQLIVDAHEGLIYATEYSW